MGMAPFTATLMNRLQHFCFPPGDFRLPREERSPPWTSHVIERTGNQGGHWPGNSDYGETELLPH